MQKEKVKGKRHDAKMLKKLCALSLILILFISCTKKNTESIIEIKGLTYKSPIELQYAKAFRADTYTSQSETETSLQSTYVLLTVSGSDRYLLVPQGQKTPQILPEKTKIIQLPVQNACLCASSAMSLLARLNCLNSIRFSAIQKKDWYIEEAQHAMEKGSILYAGKYNAPDFELLLKEKCPLAIESTMIYHSPQIQEKLESLGITVFVDKSSYEEHPLGRLEWIKAYGLLTGKFDEAKAFFESQNQRIKEVSGEAKSQKTIAFFYITPSGTVIIRGSDDYIVKMIELSGGKYAFNKTRKSKSPSIQISLEEFYAQAGRADIMIYNSSIDNTVHSMPDLLEKNPLLADFKAVKSGQIWATGKYLYQATDRIADMILDLNSIMQGRANDEELNFLTKVE